MSHRRGDSRGSLRGFHGEKRRGGSGSRGPRPYQDQPKTPIILAKPSLPSDRTPSRASPSSQEIDSSSEKRHLLSRKDSAPPQPVIEDNRNVESPVLEKAKTSSTITSHDLNSDQSVPSRNVKLIDDHQFCEVLGDYLSADNADFIVVGVIGTQSVGKSRILNAIIKPNTGQDHVQADQDSASSNGHHGTTSSRMFRVQTFDKQMLSEHCTNGINAWISPNRVIFLDSQPLFSNSVLDRAVQYEKKYSFEFNGAETTMEVHSLQMIGFFTSICHLVLVVQEGPICDSDLIERIKIAELLKPSFVAPKSFNELDKMTEYSPEVIFVHNKIKSGDYPQSYASLTTQYEKLFNQASHNFRMRTRLSGDLSDDSVNVVLLPDFEEEEKNIVSFDESIADIRRALNKLQIRPFSSNNVKHCEKAWFIHAQKVWEQIKSNSFYLEYSRLLRLKSV